MALALHALAWLSTVSALSSSAPRPTPAPLCADLFTPQHCEALGARCSEPGVAPYCRLSCGACGTDADADAEDVTPGPEPVITLSTPAATYIPERAPILHLQPELDGTEQHLSTSMFPQGRQGVSGSIALTVTETLVPTPTPTPTPQHPNPLPHPQPHAQPQP
jgi:hypothetical protein